VYVEEERLSPATDGQRKTSKLYFSSSIKRGQYAN
jgi:hypothetical protein